MTEKYLLPCQCGQQNKIDQAQAGQTITCQCGQQLEVPTLRGIRQLDQAEISDTKKRETTWSRSQGVLLSFCIAVALITFIIATGIMVKRSYIDTEKPSAVEIKKELFGAIGTVDENEVLINWNEWNLDSQVGLRSRLPAPYLMNRFYAKKLLDWSIGFFVVGLIAVAIGLSTILFAGKTRQ